MHKDHPVVLMVVVLGLRVQRVIKETLEHRYQKVILVLRVQRVTREILVHKVLRVIKVIEVHRVHKGHLKVQLVWFCRPFN